MAAQFDWSSDLLDIKEGTLTFQEAKSMVDRTPAATADKDRDCEEGGTSRIGGCYEIKVGGHLDEHWAEWFANLSLTHDAQGNTLLVGPIGGSPGRRKRARLTSYEDLPHGRPWRVQ